MERTGRSILYSLSPGVSATPEMAEQVAHLSHMYRTTSDDWDSWSDVLSHFPVARWALSNNNLGCKPGSFCYVYIVTTVRSPFWLHLWSQRMYADSEVAVESLGLLKWARTLKTWRDLNEPEGHGYQCKIYKRSMLWPLWIAELCHCREWFFLMLCSTYGVEQRFRSSWTDWRSRTAGRQIMARYGYASHRLANRPW